MISNIFVELILYILINTIYKPLIYNDAITPLLNTKYNVTNNKIFTLYKKLIIYHI